ncbi:CDP-6-deoxy-delta-3,4-glucoseen reductase [Inmirania thermothiophila]|uniref:CDP-4-dehydro-6-deoxyglucose reductase n=1 Tax=Inmirania thermothiophila TaxID=1750597 RepID=A0A3N1Y9U7_9GAMM|nr:CDP-6-deoxy-delta-3,4-glucoseen reductase [Inmirania thermothiophila]ROR34392.1 CDP-4-dehydro-6-deoxyglucose reductase [Inmirania thermothiophila]
MTYKVTIQGDDRGFEAGPGEALLDAALRAGVELPYGCRNGACGSCKVRVVAGEVTYPGGTPAALPPAERAQGLALACRAVPASDLVIEVPRPAGDAASPKVVPARVDALELLAPDVMRLWLVLPETVRVPYRAGQYLNVVLPDGRRRAFSIANAPHSDERIELHIRYVPGGDFTSHVFRGLKVKDLLRIELPLGRFGLREDSALPALLVAGGTGFAPLKAMLEHAFHVGLRRPLRLYWGARSRAGLYLADLPERWAAEHPHFSFTPVLSDPLPADGWRGRTGLVTDAVVEDHPDLSGFEVYVAGPPAMVDAAAKLFPVHRLPPERLYSDAFEFARDGARGG